MAALSEHEARQKAIDARLKQIPKSMLRTYEKAVGGHSRASAINACCQECAGYSRATIRECTSLACPLWPYRPYQHGDEGAEGDDDGV